MSIQGNKERREKLIRPDNKPLSVGYGGREIRILKEEQLSEEQRKKMVQLKAGRVRASLNALAFGMLRDKFIVGRMRNRGYPYYALRGFDFSAVVTINPFLLSFLLKDQEGASGNKASVPLEVFRNLVGISSVSSYRLPGLPDIDIDSLFVHRHLRETFSPDLTWKGPQSHQELYKNILTKQAEKIFLSLQHQFLKAQENGISAEVNITELTTEYTLGVIFETLFGLDNIHDVLSRMHSELTEQKKESFSGLPELKAFIRVLNKWVSTVSNFGSLRLAANLFPNLKKECEDLSIKFGNFTTWMLQNAIHTHLDGSQTMFGKLIQHHAVNTDNAQLNARNTEIRRGMVAGMTIVGFETTAIALQRLLFRLREVPDLLNKIEQAFNSGNEQYIENIFLEECRLNPPVPRLARKLNQDLIIEDGDKVIELPKDTVLVYLVQPANRDASVWPSEFDLNEFIPERWNKYRSKEGKGAVTLPDYYLVFGRGNTRCTGIDLAIAEVKEFLRQLVKHRTQFKLLLTQPNSTDKQHTDWVIAEHYHSRLMAKIVPGS